jgi:hypothetical protein
VSSTSPAVALPGVLQRVLGRVGAARDWLVDVRQVYVLGTLLAVQWAALTALALTVRHNGWVYYMGGDQLWHYSGGYLLGHGQLAPTFVGVGWSTILTPISWVAGPDLVSALPFIVLLNALVLVPIALVCVYGIAERIGGRLFGYWAALLWIVIPYAGIRYALPGYHQKYTELTLPQVLGLTAMSDLPSVVALLVGAYLCLRAVDGGHWLWPAGAGLAVGYALAIKPSNAVFLVAPALLFLFYRRRAVLPFALGLAPPLAVLAYWKERGFGRIPAFATPPPERRVAAGVGDVFHPATRYFRDNSWTQLHNNLLQLREHLWSDRVLEFLAVAGIVALFIRSRRAGAFVGSWFVVFLLLKGTYINARVEDGGFWRLLLPAFPAFVLMVASLPLLLPGVRLRPLPPRPLHVRRPFLVGGLAAALAIFVLFPTALIAAAKPSRLPDIKAIRIGATLVPVAPSLDLRATGEPNGVLLAWKGGQPAAGKVFFHVFRSPLCTPTAAQPDVCISRPIDLVCAGVPASAPNDCTLASESRGTTRKGAWLDRPGPGKWVYRVGVAANWLDDPQFGDVQELSDPVTVAVRR